MSPNSAPQTVVLLGKIGHGKTRICNELCGTGFESLSCSESCTRTLQVGNSLRHHLRVVDTPGFYSSTRVQDHIRDQIRAMQGAPITGIYIVIKYGRADDLAETLNRIMDFVGDDDIRILVTNCENVDKAQLDESKERLARLLDVSYVNIAMVGLDSDPQEIEDFVYSTLHNPRQFEVTKEQVAYMSSVSVGARQFNRYFADIHGKLKAARLASRSLAAYERSYEASLAITATRIALDSASKQVETNILRGMDDLVAEDRSQVMAELRSLHGRVSEFMASTKTLFKVKQVPGYLMTEFLRKETGFVVLHKVNGLAVEPKDLLRLLKTTRSHNVVSGTVGHGRKRNKKRKRRRTHPSTTYEDAAKRIKTEGKETSESEALLANGPQQAVLDHAPLPRQPTESIGCATVTSLRSQPRPQFEVATCEGLISSETELPHRYCVGGTMCNKSHIRIFVVVASVVFVLVLLFIFVLQK